MDVSNYYCRFHFLCPWSSFSVFSSFSPAQMPPPLGVPSGPTRPLSLPVGTPLVVGKRGLEKQTKESARRYVIYCVRLGHMFVLVGCGRGARPYVSIMRRWAICLYWLAVGVGLGHMFLLCGAR